MLNYFGVDCTSRWRSHVVNVKIVGTGNACTRNGFGTAIAGLGPTVMCHAPSMKMFFSPLLFVLLLALWSSMAFVGW